MLDKLLTIETEFSLEKGGDNSIYTKIEHFFKLYGNVCCSCMTPFTNDKCFVCDKKYFIREELAHSTELWYNTGYRNIYQSCLPVYMRSLKEKFELSVVPEPMDEGSTLVPEIFTERAALVRFTNCKSRTPPRLTRCCATKMGEILSWDPVQMTHLQLPSPLKTYLKETWDETKRVRQLHSACEIGYSRRKVCGFFCFPSKK